MNYLAIDLITCALPIYDLFRCFERKCRASDLPNVELVTPRAGITQTTMSTASKTPREIRHDAFRKMADHIWDLTKNEQDRELVLLLKDFSTALHGKANTILKGNDDDVA